MFIDRTKRITSVLNRYLNVSSCMYVLANSNTFPAINITAPEVRVPVGSRIRVINIGIPLMTAISHSIIIL